MNKYQNSHLLGKGCPICNESKGEKNVSKYLDNKNIPFDFYLPEMNICIEFDGQHHFESYYGVEQYEKT